MTHGQPPNDFHFAPYGSDDPPDPLPLKTLIVPPANTIPPRPWLYGYWLMRGAVTLMAAPGGTGKTSLITTAMLACASGKNLLGEEPHRKLVCAFIGLEETEQEMHRRFAAAMIHYQINADDIGDRIGYLDGRSCGFKAAKMNGDGAVHITGDMTQLAGLLMMSRCDVLVADPFALTHDAQENDNTAMAAVLSFFTMLAVECNIAVLLIHHTRKGAIAGDVDAIRGAGALVNHARIAIGLSRMTNDEREQLNVSKEDARSLVRVDDLKANYAPLGADAKWLKLESVRLGNGTEDYPYGDSIQVPINWTPPSSGLTTQLACRILEALDAGLEIDGTPERYTTRKDSDRAAFTLVKAMLEADEVEMSDKQIAGVIKAWERNNVINMVDYESGTQRKKRRGIVLNRANMPGDR